MGAWAPSRSATARGHGCNSHRAGRAVGLVHRTIGTSACAVKSAPAWQHGVAELRLSSIDTPASLVDQVPLRRAAHAPRLHRMPTTPPKRKPVSCRTSAPPSGTSSSGLHVRHRAQLLQHNRAHLRKARHSPRVHLHPHVRAVALDAHLGDRICACALMAAAPTPSGGRTR